MKSFKLSNDTDQLMQVAFEPTGEAFNLPTKEHIRIVMTEYDSGDGIDTVDVVFQENKGLLSVSVWAETHKFDVIYKDEKIFSM